MTDILSLFLKITPSCFSVLMAITGLITFLAGILRYSSLIPEPELPLKTPFGKLPFFDGIGLYGIVTLFLLMLAKGMMLLWG